jgi:hypothetical protein
MVAEDPERLRAMITYLENNIPTANDDYRTEQQ